MFVTGNGMSTAFFCADYLLRSFNIFKLKGRVQGKVSMVSKRWRHTFSGRRSLWITVCMQTLFLFSSLLASVRGRSVSF